MTNPQKRHDDPCMFVDILIYRLFTVYLIDKL